MVFEHFTCFLSLSLQKVHFISISNSKKPKAKSQYQ
jgi:hypothetical protein